MTDNDQLCSRFGFTIFKLPAGWHAEKISIKGDFLKGGVDVQRES